MRLGIDRRLLLDLDWVLLGSVLVLCGFGLMMILSATQTGPGLPTAVVRQGYAVLLGLVGLLVVLGVDYHRLVDRAPLLYLLSLGLLGFVLGFGPRIAGTHRWLVVGPVQVQVSEFVKLVAALVAAKLFAESKKDSLGLADMIVPGATIGLLAILIAAAPDLGTAFCLVPLLLGVALLAGLRLKAVAGLAVVLAVVGGLSWQFALKDYQKSRIYSFLDPQLDPQGAGYQKIQSQIAVGSGGLAGKGFRQGTQTQLGYLPARHTDFIFSVLAEELGFLGVAATLLLYMLVLWRSLEAARLARDRSGAFLATGVASVMAFQVVYNVAMVAGLVPVKGLPLPFMSYGGSSVLSSLLGVGLVLNVRMRRFAN